jgi:hypothetical protein
MAFPEGAPVITVRGRWLNIDGSSARGDILVKYAGPAKHGDVIYTGKPLRIALDGNGEIEFSFVKTSEPVKLLITEEVVGAKKNTWTAVIKEIDITDNNFNLTDGLTI